MKKLAWTAAGFSLLGLCVSARSQPPQPTAKMDADSAVVKQSCVTCHNDRAKTGGLSLAAFDVQAFSPTLMEGYLRAASKVTALAVGDADVAASESHYRVPKTASQLRRADGAPLGTRGGLSVVHTFPADGDYVFRMDLHGNA